MPLVPASPPVLRLTSAMCSPLEAGSCSSPSLASSILDHLEHRVGSGTRGCGYPGNPLTAEDEADMAIDLPATDVKKSTLRLLVRGLGVHASGDGHGKWRSARNSGTVRTSRSEWPLPCLATPDPVQARHGTWTRQSRRSCPVSPARASGGVCASGRETDGSGPDRAIAGLRLPADVWQRGRAPVSSSRACSRPDVTTIGSEGPRSTGLPIRAARDPALSGLSGEARRSSTSAPRTLRPAARRPPPGAS